MRESERSFRKVVQNSITAAAIIATPSISINSVNAESDTSKDIIASELPQDQGSDLSVFEQVDDFMDTDTGKTLAGLFLLYSALNMVRTFHHGQKLDSKRKFSAELAASSSLLALSATLMASTMTEVDPKIPASLFMATATFQAAYAIEDEMQRWRGMPIVPRIGMAVTFFGIGITLLVDSLK